MRKSLMLLTAIVLILGVVPTTAQDPTMGGSGVGDPYYPQLGNTGYDVLHYTIELSVNPDDRFIDGSTTITAQTTQDLTAFNLDFYGLDITELLVDNAPAAYTRDDTELIITPATKLTEGSEFTVTVAYSGNPDFYPDPGVHHRDVGWLTFDAGMFVFDEPSGAMTWFPSNNHPTDKATFTFRITVPQPYVAAANGLLQDEIENGDTTTYVFEASDPMATYLAAVNVAELERISSEGPDGLPIHNYFPPDAPDPLIREFDSVPNMIVFYSEVFGPYPFESIGFVVMQDRRSLNAIENQTLINIAVNTADQDTIAHELVHMWFGDSVSVKTWQDMWLSEGFATYGAALWFEHILGVDELNATMNRYYNTLARINHPPPADPTPQDIFGITVYYRGALALHALRLTVGDNAFFDILRTYYDRYQYANASTADFITVAEEISGQDLSALFGAWLYDEELPPMP